MEPPPARSQAHISASSPRVVPKLRISLPPRLPPRFRQATTPAWCTSRPAQQATIASMSSPCLVQSLTPRDKVRLYHACSPLPGATKGNTLEAARIKLCVGIAQHHQTKERPRSDHTFRVSWFAPCRQMHTIHARAFSAIAVPAPPAG